MKLSRYIAERRGEIAAFAAVAAAVALLLILLKVNILATALAVAAIIGVEAAFILYEYRRRSRFFAAVRAALAGGLAGADDLPTADFFEGEELLSAISQASAELEKAYEERREFARNYALFADREFPLAQSAAKGSRDAVNNLRLPQSREICFKIDELFDIADRSLFFAKAYSPDIFPLSGVRLRAAAMDAISDCSHSLIENRVGVGVRGLDFDVAANRELLTFIIRQLLMNSVRFRAGKGAVKLSAADEGERVRLTVSDNGVGMDEKTLSRAFEYGFSGDGKGAGAGLFLCKRLCDGMGAEITLSSAPECGTTVEILFKKQA